jgi:hypothetical protein
MADEVFSLRNIFTTAVLALAIDLLFVFPVSHFSAWGKAITTSMAQTYGFLSSGAGAAAATVAKSAAVPIPGGGFAF